MHVAKRKDRTHGAAAGGAGCLVEEVDVVLHRRGGGMRNDATETAGLEILGQETGLHLGGDADGGLEGSSSVVFGSVNELFNLIKTELIAQKKILRSDKISRFKFLFFPVSSTSGLSQ